MEFVKSHGIGNDFILIDAKTCSLPQDLASLSRKLCDRHFGIGGDGLIIVHPSALADTRMQIINSDGSEAEMCGNGLRCFVQYVYTRAIVPNTTMMIETLAGILTATIIPGDDPNYAMVQVDMGEPILRADQVPVMTNQEQAIDLPIEVAEKTFRGTAVSMGNPHWVMFVDEIVEEEMMAYGPKIEKTVHFPRKTNVEWVQVLSPTHLRMRVWERGAAITQACGTGACASAVAGVLNGHSERQVKVSLDGGDLLIHWDEMTNHVHMTGPTEMVYTGRVYDEMK